MFIRKAIGKLCRKTAAMMLKILPPQGIEFFSLFLHRFSKDADTIKYRKYAIYISRNYETVCSKLRKNPRYMIIREVTNTKKIFDVGTLNNTLQLILYALSKGRIPVIKINEGIDNYYQWDWFFVQPSKVIFDDFEYCPVITSDNSIECDINYIPYPNFWEFYLADDNQDYIAWSFLFKTFVRLNDNFQEYVDKEKESLGVNLNKCLGVLLRGTDYISLEPKGHPIQPDVDVIIQKCKEYMAKYNYEKVYIATEEKRLYDIFSKKVGEEKCLFNKRTYYDDKYKEGTWISSFYEDKESEYYRLGAEYLSSLVILSSCGGLVAGNCGGTKFAKLYSNKYQNTHIYNIGYYGHTNNRKN